jgi:hypothetical protein
VNRIVRLDGHGRKRIAAFRKLVSDGKIIPGVYSTDQQNRDANNAEEYVFQPLPSLTRSGNDIAATGVPAFDPWTG